MAENGNRTTQLSTLVVVATSRRKKFWIGIIVSLIIIAAIAIPTTLILIEKNKQIPTNGTMEENSSTIREIITTTIQMKTVNMETSTIKATTQVNATTIVATTSTITIAETTSIIATTEMETTSITATTEMETTKVTVMTTTEKSDDQCHRRYQLVEDYENSTNFIAMISDDVDGDKRFDIIVVDSFFKKIDILFNDGNDIFTIQTLPHVDDYSPRSVSTGDVNNDDRIDIIVLADDRQKIIIFLNIGNRTFIKHMNYSTGDEPVFVTMVDVNKDKHPDIIIGYNNKSMTSIHINDGNGSFSNEGTFHQTLCGSYLLLIIDMNRDSDIDFLGVCPLHNNMDALFNINNQTFVIRNSFLGNLKPTIGPIVNVKIDELSDFTVAPFDLENIGIFLHNGIDEPTKLTILPNGALSPSVVVDDINGDMKPDIVLANVLSGYIDIFLNADDNQFINGSSYSTHSIPYFVAIADINNDSQLDIIVAHKNSVGVLYTKCS